MRLLQKQVLLTVVCIAFSATGAFAEWAPLPAEHTAPVQSIDISLTCNGSYGLERNTFPCSLGYSWQWEPVTLSAAVQAGGDIRDTSFSGTWLPLQIKHTRRSWAFGMQSLYHYQRYRDVYGEHDAITYAVVQVQHASGIKVVLQEGVAYKSANIYAVSTPVTNWYPAVSLSVNKSWQNGIELYGAAGSQTQFRYPLFFSPSFTIGAAVTLNDFFRPSVEWCMTCTDFFAASLYINRMAVRIAGRFSL